MRKVLILGLCIALFSCQNETESEIDKEIEVINDIFLQIPEYFSFFSLTNPPPPPPPPIYNEKGEFVSVDSIRHKEILEKYEQNKREIDTTFYVLAFNDSLVNNEEIELTDWFLQDTFFVEFAPIIETVLSNDKQPYQIDLEKIEKIGKYKLEPLSSFPPGRQIYRKKYHFDFYGVLTLSRVYFNEDYNKAILYCSYFCGIDCASGKLFLVEKVNNKWKIVAWRLMWIA